MDKLTKRAALALSRRGFLKKLPLIGGAVGLGLGGASNVYACDPCTQSSCGSCVLDSWCIKNGVTYRVGHNPCGLKCSGPSGCP